MSDEIKVGDRVHVSVEYDGIVCVLDGDEACVEDDDGIHCTHVLSELTHIEPEPVTVTVKYPPGTRVRLRQEHDHVFMVDRVEILYRDPADNSHSWYEDSLEPCDCAKCSSE